MPVIPKKLLSDCKMKRVICHWSEGNYKANETDLPHHHILIEGDGSVRAAITRLGITSAPRTVTMRLTTLGANTGSIGVSRGCMVDCAEKPFAPSRQPMKQSQWDVM